MHSGKLNRSLRLRPLSSSKRALSLIIREQRMRTTATTLSIAITLLAGRVSAEQITVANLAVAQLMMTADHCAVIGAVNNPVFLEGLLYLLATAASEPRLITITMAVLLVPRRVDASHTGGSQLIASQMETNAMSAVVFAAVADSNVARTGEPSRTGITNVNLQALRSACRRGLAVAATL